MYCRLDVRRFSRRSGVVGQKLSSSHSTNSIAYISAGEEDCLQRSAADWLPHCNLPRPEWSSKPQFSCACQNWHRRIVPSSKQYTSGDICRRTDRPLVSNRHIWIIWNGNFWVVNYAAKLAETRKTASESVLNRSPYRSRLPNAG